MKIDRYGYAVASTGRKADVAQTGNELTWVADGYVHAVLRTSLRRHESVTMCGQDLEGMYVFQRVDFAYNRRGILCRDCRAWVWRSISAITQGAGTNAIGRSRQGPAASGNTSLSGL